MGGKLVPVEQIFQYLQDGCTLMYGGFGGVGNPPTIIDSIIERGIKDLTLIGNDAGFPTIGIGRLVTTGRVKRLIASHIGSNPVAGQLMHEKKLEIEFVPQGTLVERIRAGGVGLGGILVDTGIGTMLDQDKNKLELGNKSYFIEPALTADVAIVYAKKADHFGNLIYDKTARNTNPLVAMAGAVTIAEVEEIVPNGALSPEEIVTPGVFVDYIVQSQGVNWKWVWESI